jgi:hypothetical protein
MDTHIIALGQIGPKKLLEDNNLNNNISKDISLALILASIINNNK